MRKKNKGAKVEPRKVEPNPELWVTNEAGAAICIEQRTATAIDELPVEGDAHFCILWIGEVPIRLAENAYALAKRIMEDSGNKVPVKTLPLDPDTGAETKILNRPGANGEGGSSTDEGEKGGEPDGPYST